MGNVETESDKINQVDMIEDKYSAGGYEKSKNDEETLTDFDEESDEIDQIEESKEDNLESENQKLMKDIR